MAKTIEDLDREIAQLKARKQKLVAREKDRERKQRNHALIVFGSMVEAACGGDWRAIDPSYLNAYLTKWSRTLKNEVVYEPLSSSEADAEIRAWERAQREAKKEDRKVVEAVLEEIREEAAPADPAEADQVEQPDFDWYFGWDDEDED